MSTNIVVAASVLNIFMWSGILIGLIVQSMKKKDM
jgi:hypothetical protein